MVTHCMASHLEDSGSWVDLLAAALLALPCASNQRDQLRRGFDSSLLPCFHNPTDHKASNCQVRSRSVQ